MRDIYPRDSLEIHKALNGFIVTVKGTKEQQEDRLDGVYIFENTEKLNAFIRDYYEKLSKKP